MPIYEYHCENCHKDYEIFQKISDPPLSTCPKCGKKVKRLISQTSFTLKGGGWYKDGYSAKSGVGTGGDKKATETKAESKSAGDSKGSSGKKK